MAEQLAFDFNAPLPTLPQLWTPDDIYGKLDEAAIAKFKEDGRLERKRGTINQKDIAEYFSMWANTQPHGGIILVGVENNGVISGLRHIETEHINTLEAARRLCSDARVENKRIAVKNHKGEDDYVIAFRVLYREDKLVETSHGDAFVREGEEKRKLTETEKREVRLNKGELDVESERAILKYPDEFDLALIAEFRHQYLTKRSLSYRYSNEEILALNKLGKLARNNFEPNLACALLFAKDSRNVIPGAYIRIIRYDGIEEKFGLKQNIVADQVFDGPLARQITEAEKFILSQMRNFTRLGRDGRFETKPEYPREVWLEAVVNAVVHRSYNLRHMNIFIKMFENKLVIESPGSFMPPTTAETVYDAHNPRNPNLMWAMYYFDYVQCAFEGTRRMRAAMREANLPDPVFVQKQSGTFQVSVTLENDQEHRKLFVRDEAAIAINPELYATLTENEKMIVNYLTDHPHLNVNDAAKIIVKDWRRTKSILEGLVAKRIIERSPGNFRSKHRFYSLSQRSRRRV
ncbi:ATP-binding protein [Bradyrhizobium cenepequi]